MSKIDTRKKNPKNPGINKSDWGEMYDYFYEEEAPIIAKKRRRPYIGSHNGNPDRDSFSLACRKARRNARSEGKTYSAVTTNNDTIKVRSKYSQDNTEKSFVSESRQPRRPAKVTSPPIEIKRGAPGPFDCYGLYNDAFDRSQAWFRDMSNHKTTMAQTRVNRGKPQFKGHTGGRIAV